MRVHSVGSVGGEAICPGLLCPSQVGLAPHTHTHTHKTSNMLWLVRGVREESARLIVAFVFMHGVLLNVCFEGILHLDIISGGKVGTWRRDRGKSRMAAHCDDMADG